ncbi:MAG: AAA family ATPase [Bacteroidia bacterium]|jgi:tRNA uridine 5-carbamoylmethylation protein Kti12
MQTSSSIHQLLYKSNQEAAAAPNKISITEVFSERAGSYINEYKLFVSCFNAIPNMIEESDINCRKANSWFVENYEQDITNMHFIKRYLPGSKKPEYDDIFYFLYDDLIVNFDTNCSEVRFLFRKTNIEKVETLIAKFKKYKRRQSRETPEISLLVEGSSGIYTKTLDINKPKLKLDDNYNEDFKEIHDTILKRLKSKNDKGIVLLHGKPGTGKTSYIRYLISAVKKRVVFLPPNMAGLITSPNLISILIDHPNSIFVIEDAENIVVDRERDGVSPVSALLNVADGLLADCLNVQIICSFNTDITKVDKAILRKGRLIARYEFKELAVEKAQLLSNKLGFKTSITEPMTLAAIYNQDEKDFDKSKADKPLGFLKK